MADECVLGSQLHVFFGIDGVLGHVCEKIQNTHKLLYTLQDVDFSLLYNMLKLMPVLMTSLKDFIFMSSTKKRITGKIYHTKAIKWRTNEVSETKVTEIKHINNKPLILIKKCVCLGKFTDAALFTHPELLKGFCRLSLLDQGCVCRYLALRHCSHKNQANS